MKKRILSMALIVCLAMTLLPTLEIKTSAVEPVSDTVIEARINELYAKLDGKYFNVGQDISCGKKNTWHGCGDCLLHNIMQTQWFKNMFGVVKDSQIDGGTYRNSCVGFVAFARWYIFRVDNNDVVKADTIKQGLKFNYDSISQNAHIGDYLWLNGKYGNHAVIYIGCDKNGVTVLDCNWAGQYNCLVKKRVASYSDFYTFNISRAYSTKAGKGNVNIKEPVIAHPEEDVYKLVPACAAGSALDVDNNRTDSGANLHIWQGYESLTSQKWALDKENGDYYSITNCNSEKKISIQGNSAVSGANVCQKVYGRNDAQKWRFEEAGDGYYYIVPQANTDICLDVSSASNENGANVQVYTKNYTSAQKWKLVKTACPQHQRSNFNFNEAAHPHYKYYECAWCGETFTEYETGYDESCETCNPKSSVWELFQKPFEEMSDSIKKKEEEKAEEEKKEQESSEPSWKEGWDKLKDTLIGKDDKTEEEPPVTPTPEPGKEWHFTEWSDWSDVEYTPSGTREVETRRVEVSPAKTQYRYGNFLIGSSDIWDVDYGYSLGWKGTVKENWTEWRDTPIPYVGRKTFCADNSHNHQHVKSYEVEGWATWYLYREDGVWDGWSRPYYYWEETRTVPATEKTQYRYRDWVND